ncbi:MAG: hypothetical protein IJB81_03060 [Clostridia bacterium]|nr:hypothetical protein [Clostridia bacterium]
MNLKPVFEAVIRGGNYKLSNIQEKIEKSYIENRLTEQDRDDLLRQASESMNITGEKPSDDARFETLLRYIHALEDRVMILEEKVSKPEEGEAPEAPEAPEEDEVVYEQWKPWDGISNKYQPGAVVSHNDKLWESIHPGQNVWEPGSLGTERIWQEYVNTNTRDKEAE